MMERNLIIDSNDEIQEKSPNFEKRESPGSSQKNSASREKTKPNPSKWTKNPMYKNAQIKKPTRRTPNSPLKWSPRKKHDSYLKRKIKHLQETGGMNLTLDETLESANLHFTRIAREKIAAKEAAKRAMEARKSAMVEASWCRILNAARIKNKEAEMELEKAKTRASEAFESARKMGVMMYDRPDSDQNRYGYEIETTGTGTKITASFETPFEVDKQVAHAVKKAFLQLANKEEFKGLLWKIRENPRNNNTGLFDISSESGTCLVGTMLQGLKGLKEEELVSLAEIVATCGLSDSLRLSVDERYELGLGFQETGTKKKEVEDSSCVPSLDKLLVKRVSKLEREVEEARKQNRNESKQNRVTGTDPGSVPGLDCVLVKHMSKLEREVQEAKIRNRNECKENKVTGKDSGSVPGLDCVLVKHMSKLEREVQEAKKKNDNSLLKNNESGQTSRESKGTKETGTVGSLGDLLVKKNGSKIQRDNNKFSDVSSEERGNEFEVKNELLDRKKEREIEMMKYWGDLSLENSIRPRVSRIERDKIAWKKAEEEKNNSLMAKI